MTCDPLVSIRCMVYNHEPYLRQCLEGIVMQKTTFPFEAIIHDDASTDGSADIIREFADKYPDIIKPIYETENQYSKHDGSLGRNIRAVRSPHAKYYAICEGDDYWTDPNKLQLQVDFLESHPECTLACHACNLFSEAKGKIVFEQHCRSGDGELLTVDVIRRGGLFICTCSIVYRRELIKNYPDYCKKCHVGDFPLQIMGVMKGKVMYFDRLMGTYRINNPQSWMSKNDKENNLSLKRLKGMRSEVNMYKGFAADYPEYESIFKDRIAFYLTYRTPIKKVTPQDYTLFVNEFHQEIKAYSLFWKLFHYARQSQTNILTKIYYRILPYTKYSKFGMSSDLRKSPS